MGWMKNRAKNIRTLRDFSIISLFFYKFLLGLGIGMVLANYFTEYNWILFGWILIILAVIVGLPTSLKILK